MYLIPFLKDLVNCDSIRYDMHVYVTKPTSAAYPEFLWSAISNPGPPATGVMAGIAWRCGKHALQVNHYDRMRVEASKGVRHSQKGSFASSSFVFALPVGIECLANTTIFSPCGSE